MTSSEQRGNMLRLSSVVFFCNPSGCPSGHDAPAGSHGCRMKCHQRPHSQRRDFVSGLCGPRAEIRANGNPPPSLGPKEADWLRHLSTMHSGGPRSIAERDIKIYIFCNFFHQSPFNLLPVHVPGLRKFLSNKPSNHSFCRLHRCLA